MVDCRHVIHSLRCAQMHKVNRRTIFVKLPVASVGAPVRIDAERSCRPGSGICTCTARRSRGNWLPSKDRDHGEHACARGDAFAEAHLAIGKTVAIDPHSAKSACANLTESKAASAETTHPFAGASLVSITTSCLFS